MPKTNIVKKVRLSRGEQNARRSEELLESAWTVFCDKGYESVTIDDVSAQAGYSRTPLYSPFGNTQRLFFALLQRTIDRLLAMLLNATGAKVPQTGQPARKGRAGKHGSLPRAPRTLKKKKTQ